MVFKTPLQHISISVMGHDVTGTIRLGRDVYRMEPVGAGLHAIILVDESGFPPEDPGNVPERFAIYANYPNPFNPNTHINFGIPETDLVRIDIIDIHGHVVNNLLNKPIIAARHLVTWRGNTSAGGLAPSGCYLCRIRYRGEVKIHKIMLVR